MISIMIMTCIAGFVVIVTTGLMVLIITILVHIRIIAIIISVAITVYSYYYCSIIVNIMFVNSFAIIIIDVMNVIVIVVD